MLLEVSGGPATSGKFHYSSKFSLFGKTGSHCGLLLCGYLTLLENFYLSVLSSLIKHNYQLNLMNWLTI